LVKDLVPNLITVSGIQRVLQILLAERVSIRDLATILEGVADGIAGSRNSVTRPSTCARVCRSRHSPSR
jgi:flagellar biosynthesis protein FlhA